MQCCRYRFEMEFESWYSGDEDYLQIDVNQTATPMPRLVVSLSFDSNAQHSLIALWLALASHCARLLRCRVLLG
jgi:hypothetical protein